MSTPVLLFHDIKGSQFWQDDLQQSATLQIVEADAGMSRQDNLVEFILNTFATHDTDSVCHALKGHIRLFFYLEVKLGGESHASHHTQGIIRKSDIWFQGRGDDTILQVGQSVKRIDKFPETLAIQTDGHGIDGEVTTVLVVFQGSVFNNRLAGIVAVALFPCPHELHLILPTLLTELHLGSTKIFENRQVGFLTYHPLQFCCYGNAAAYDHHVNIVGGTFQKDISHIATNNIALQTQTVCSLTDLVENFLIQQLSQFFIGI